MKNSFDECSLSYGPSHTHTQNSPPSKQIKTTNKMQKLLFKIGVFQDGRCTVAGVDKDVEGHSQTPKKMKIWTNSITFEDKQTRFSKRKIQIKFYHIRFCTQNTIWIFIYDFLASPSFYFLVVLISDYDFCNYNSHFLYSVERILDFWLVIFKRTPFLVSIYCFTVIMVDCLLLQLFFGFWLTMIDLLLHATIKCWPT